jgi:hypothetical protein
MNDTKKKYQIWNKFNNSFFCHKKRSQNDCEKHEILPSPLYQILFLVSDTFITTDLLH